MWKNKETRRQWLSEDGKDGGMDYKELEEVLGSDGYIHHLIVVLEEIPESPLDSTEIKLVNPIGNQP